MILVNRKHQILNKTWSTKSSPNLGQTNTLLRRWKHWKSEWSKKNQVIFPKSKYCAPLSWLFVVWILLFNDKFRSQVLLPCSEGSEMASFHGRRDEFSSENTTWELVSLPLRRKLVQCKWVFRNKFIADGKTWKYNSRLVAKGFSQVQGVDYHDTFAPVAKMDSICLVLAISASKHDWEVHHMDVKYAFIHGDIHEEI